MTVTAQSPRKSFLVGPNQSPNNRSLSPTLLNAGQYQGLVSVLTRNDSMKKEDRRASTASAVPSDPVQSKATTFSSSPPTKSQPFPSSLKRSSSPERRLSTTGSIPSKGTNGPSQVTFNDNSAPPTSSLSKGLLERPENLEYLHYLSTTPIDRIKAEPDHLELEKSRTARQLSSLAFSDYKSFLYAYDAAKLLSFRFSSLQECADGIQSTLPDLEASLKKVQTQAPQSANEKKMFEILLRQYPKLIDLLEIPHLFETCIQSGYYDDAMDIQNYVNKLKLRYPHLGIIGRIAEQVNSSVQDMLDQLMELLRGNVKLPLCIRIIGYLKRLDAYSEPELRLVFLQQRDAYLSSLVKSIKSTDPTEFLKKYLEVTREHFFEIITQYRAIFSDSQSVYVSSTPTSFSVFDPSGSMATQSILSSYVMYFVAGFLDTLRDKLKSIGDVAVINSLLTTTMYFGMSLGRVGIDFRAIVGECFEEAVERVIKEIIQEGLEAFLNTVRLSTGVIAVEKTIVGPPLFSLTNSSTGSSLGSGNNLVNSKRRTSLRKGGGTLATIPVWNFSSETNGRTSSSIPPVSSQQQQQQQSQVLQRLSSSNLVAPSNRSSVTTTGGAGNSLEPPTILLHFPALAVLYNTLMTALNQLRLCPMTSLYPSILISIHTCLECISHALAQLGESAWDSWSDTRRRDFEDLCRLVSDGFIPLVVKAVEEGVFGSVPITSLPVDSTIDGSVIANNQRDRVKGLQSPLNVWAHASRLRLTQEEIMSQDAVQQETPSAPSSDEKSPSKPNATPARVEEEYEPTSEPTSETVVAVKESPVDVKKEAEEGDNTGSTPASPGNAQADAAPNSASTKVDNPKPDNSLSSPTAESKQSEPAE